MMLLRQAEVAAIISLRTSRHRLFSTFGVGWVSEKERNFQGQNIFGEFAEEYDAHRPDYPPSFWSWMLEQLRAAASVKELTTLVGVDLAAGTGRGASRFASAGLKTIAVEPDEKMLAVCKRNLEKEGLAARYIQAKAEHLPLPDCSVDIVQCLQAWHWVDPVSGQQHVHRVLKPKGVLVLAWNDRNLDHAWTHDFELLIEEYNPKYNRHARQCQQFTEPLITGTLFRLVEHQPFDNALYCKDYEQFFDLCMTFSYVRKVLNRETTPAFRRDLAELHRLSCGLDGSITIPLITHAYSFTKQNL